MMPSAVILAGSRPGRDPFAQSVGVSHKALIELEGCTLLERVVTALRDAGIERIAVSCSSGPVAELAIDLKAEVIPSESGPSGSVAAAFEKLGPPLIVTTCDHARMGKGIYREDT